MQLPQIHEVRTDGMRLLAVRTHTKDVVVIVGSILGGSHMQPVSKRAVAWTMEDLLDAGTKKHTKEELRDQLSSLGASLSFSCGGDRLFFEATCLPEDIDTVLGIVVECLTEATFPKKEIELSIKRQIAGRTESKSDTGREAVRALERTLYEKSHPGYTMTADEGIVSLRKVTRKDIVDMYRKLGRTGLTFAIGGDIDPEKCLRLAERKLKALPEGKFAPTVMPVPKRQPKKEVLVKIKDKANVDVMLGVRALINRDHPQFLAFRVLLSLLGGGGISTGHLMRTVRERDGLTYGIRAFAAEFADRADGYMAIWATFAPKVYEKGVETIRKEVRSFFRNGITKELLEAKKEEMLGKYLVGLSTTSGLVSTLHGNAIEDKETAYLLEYPKELQKLTLDDIHNARKLVPLTELSLAAAGTFAKP
ncbi:MAG TPA: pitrilysin family protein [Candidatus Paceibacterota bacterium]|nr:pitrilysin family protein [Candidatus Paceibacterota bacterium]